MERGAGHTGRPFTEILKGFPSCAIEHIYLSSDPPLRRHWGYYNSTGPAARTHIICIRKGVRRHQDQTAAELLDWITTCVQTIPERDQHLVGRSYI